MSDKTGPCVCHHDFTHLRDQAVTVARRDDAGQTATFRYADDRWFLVDLLKPHERNKEATINFSDLPAWLREDTKCYVAHLWLECHARAHGVVQTVMVLRRLARALPDFKGKPIELRARHARQFAREFEKLKLAPQSNIITKAILNAFIRFVRQQYPGETGNDFRVVLPKRMVSNRPYEPLEKSLDRKASAETLASIIDACNADLQAYYDAKATYIDAAEDAKAYNAAYYRERRRRLKAGLDPNLGATMKMSQMLSRAIKAQAVILAICTGRRPAAICNLSVDTTPVEKEWANELEQKEKVVMVRFVERKVRYTFEDVPCPGVFGELAARAIATARELTELLRRDHPAWKEYLFIVPLRGRKEAAILHPYQLNTYLNGEMNAKGLLERHGINCGKITMTTFRLTRATNAWIGGLSIHEVAQDLGQESVDTTLRHYIAGSEESRKRFEFLMRHGGLRDTLGRLAGGREPIHTELGAHLVKIMGRQRRIVTPTRYGYCALDASSGPCITANPCYIGPGASGGGCDYHVLSPDALPALEEDKEVLEATIATYSGDPEYRAWVEHHRLQLKIVEDIIEAAKTLQEKVGCCCEGTDRCDHRTRRKGNDQFCQKVSPERSVS